MGNLILS